MFMFSGPPISEGEKLVAVELAESNPSMVTQPGVRLEDIPWVFAMENMENGKVASKNFFSSHLWDGGIIYYEVTNDMTTE